MTDTASHDALPVARPGLYRHYKGRLYRVLATVRHSETREWLTLYQALYGEHALWVRPATMFLGQVVVNGAMQPRFAPLSGADDIADPPVLVSVTTTLDDREQARAMARRLTEAHLAACVQLEEIESIYPWEGQVVQAQEWRLHCKTVPERVAQLQQAIADTHPYQVPDIHVTHMHCVHSAYAEWVAGETRPATADSCCPPRQSP